MSTTDSDGSEIEALAEAERDAWFVRAVLAEGALKHARNDIDCGINLLQQAISDLAVRGTKQRDLR